MIAVAVAAMTVGRLSALEFTAGNAQVAIAPRAPGPVQFAAEEMTNFLSRVLGKPVPIVRRINPAKATIVLGTNAWSAAAGVDISKLRVDGYLMKTAGNALYIAGKDSNNSIGYCRGNVHFDRGTMMGAYAFLEKYAGCRFYFPGELGEIVPRRDSITVPSNLDVTDAPAFAERKYSYHNAGAWFDESCDAKAASRLKSLNVLRLRLASRNYITCHGLRFFRYGHRFKETHPEYFMLKADGTRYLYDTEKTPHSKNCKLCFSNRELREIIYQDIKAYLTGQPPQSRGLEKWGRSMWDRKYVGVQPEDGWNPCQCEQCKTAYRSDLGKSIATDLMWGFTKELAERLTAEGLDAVLMQSSYSAWTEPPSFDLPPNIMIDIATTGPWSVRNPDSLKRGLVMLEKWTKKLGHAVFNWTYAGKFSCLQLDLPAIPQITPRAWGAYYKIAAPYLSGEFAGTYGETQTDRFLFDALNVYVFSRVAWDPSVDVDAILEEHYRLMYGAAAKEIQAIFEKLEDVWLERICGQVVMTSVGPVNMTPSEFEIWTDIYSPAKVDALLAIADSAAAKVVPESLEARRIALVRTEILERLSRRTREYGDGLSVEREKAARAARKPVNLAEGFKPVTILVDNTMTNKPFHRVKYRLPLGQGHRYRASFFVKGENVRPYARRGGVQGIAWWDEAADAGRSFPRAGATGTFDWVHFENEFYIPKTGVDNFKPEFDLRLFFATGTAHFDGLLVEELK